MTRRLQAAAALAAAACLLGGCGGSVQVTRNPSAELPAVRKIAVLPFADDPAQRRITGEWETLLLSLGYRVIDRQNIETILKEQGLSVSGIVNPSEAPRIGDLLGVQGLVLGLPNPRPPYYSWSVTGATRLSEPGPVSVKLVDTSSARVIWSLSAEKSEALQVSREGRAVNGTVQKSLSSALREGGWNKFPARAALFEASDAVLAVNRDLPSKQGMRVGVYAFTGTNDNGDGNAWADKFGGILLKAGYDVVDREQLDRVIREQKISQSGSVRPAEMLLLGKVAGLNAVAMGNVSGGAVCAYNVKLVDIETGELYWSGYGEDCQMSKLSGLFSAGLRAK